MNDNEKYARSFAVKQRLTNPTNGMVYECVPVDFAYRLEGEIHKLRDELYAAQSAVSVKDTALSRLYCAEKASIGAEFLAAIQAEIEDAMKQAKKAINNPLTP